MRRKIALGAIIVTVFAASYFAKRALRTGENSNSAISSSDPGKNAAKFPSRIVSLAPSITETLFELGLMDRVAGVTRYCDYPPEALAKTKIGGYYDPNYEAIVALKPDLIIMLTEHEDPKQHLAKLGFDILAVDHRDIQGILRSIETIGTACGVEPKAESIVKDIRERMEYVRRKTAKLRSPRVMVSIGRNMGSGTLEDVYISGKDGFYDEMIRLAGGVNAYEGSVAFPAISNEGIIRMNPEVIIDMVPDLEEQGWDVNRIYKEWNEAYPVDAVRNDRVYVFSEDYVVVPGPRFILLLEKMGRVMYPEVNWNQN
jgi:iron complex transport system substrate-binding protein